MFGLNKLIKSVGKMHKKFGIDSETIEFTEYEKVFRSSCMFDKIQEYSDAINPVEELDTLVDLAIFAIGTAERQGLLSVFEEAYGRIMKANMTKELGPNNTPGHFILELVKPEGFHRAQLIDLIVKEKPSPMQLSLIEWAEMRHATNQ